MDWAKAKARTQGEASFRASREADAWAREQGAPARKASATKQELRDMLARAMANTPGARVRVIPEGAGRVQRYEVYRGMAPAVAPSRPRGRVRRPTVEDDAAPPWE